MEETRFEALGQRIAAARAGAGMSQQDLADTSGVGINTVKNMELGRPAQLRNVVAVADALDVTVGQLLGEPERAIDELIPGWDDLAPEQQSGLRQLVADAAATRLGGPALTEQERSLIEGLRALVPRARQLALAQALEAVRSLVDPAVRGGTRVARPSAKPARRSTEERP